MKAVSVIASIACIAMGGLVACAPLASAASDPASPAPAEAKAVGAPVKAEMPACPMCSMMAGAGKDMGKGMEMTPAMKQHCQMMTNAEMSKDDAVCLLAMKQELKLTPEQVQKLDKIAKDSRLEAAKVLTPEQQKTLADVAAQPASMNVMHSEMHQKMMKKMEGAAPKMTDEKAKKEPEGAAPLKK